MTMLRRTCVLFLALAAVSATSDRDNKSVNPPDPFELMHRLVHYVVPMKLWPWFAGGNPLEDPKLISEGDKCEIDVFAKGFAPETLKVRVKNRFVTVQGRRKMLGADSLFTDRFVQNLALPSECNEDEVVAVYENGILTISAPKYPQTPPREITIEVRRPVAVETTTEKKEEEEKKDELMEPVKLTTQPPLEQLDSVEATTHVGKIRKKELKTTTKTTKENEVIKEDNRLDVLELEK